MTELRLLFPPAKVIKRVIVSILEDSGRSLTLSEMCMSLEAAFSNELSPDLLAIPEKTRKGPKWRHVVRSEKDQLVK